MDYKLKKILALKEQKMPGHMTRYVKAEYWKVWIRLLLNIDNNLITAESSGILIFGADKDSFDKIVALLNLIENEIDFWSKSKKNIFAIICIFFPFFLEIYIKNYKTVYVTTDLKIANYNLMRKFQKYGDVICMQHGYIPYHTVGDIDGLNCDKYIVRNLQQAGLLQQHGFKGQYILYNPIKICNFQNFKLDTLIFIGPGYSHNKDYERKIYSIVTTLSCLVGGKIAYRPHQRCSSDLVNQLEQASVTISRNDETSLSHEVRKFFVGVKSTMLLDAQELGHEVVLIESEVLPKYFADGVIKKVVTSESLKSLNENEKPFDPDNPLQELLKND